MTNKEALAANVMCPVPDASLELALINTEVDPSATYSIGQREGVDLATIDVLYMVYTKQDISEGGYSESHPDFLRKIKERLMRLASQYGRADVLDLLQDQTPTITSKAVW
jgi:hypothetical protein